MKIYLFSCRIVRSHVGENEFNLKISHVGSNVNNYTEKCKFVIIFFRAFTSFQLYIERNQNCGCKFEDEQSLTFSDCNVKDVKQLLISLYKKFNVP